MSVVALSNHLNDRAHLLAVGNDLGSIDLVDLPNRSLVHTFEGVHESRIHSIGFNGRSSVVSATNREVISVDMVTTQRNTLSLPNSDILCTYFGGISDTILYSTPYELVLADRRSNPISIMDFSDVSDMYLLPDGNSLLAIKHSTLRHTDLRFPTELFDCKLSEQVKMIAANSKYVVLTSDSGLLSFEIPFCPDFMASKLEISPLEGIRPVFFQDFIVAADQSQTLFAVNPADGSFDLLSIPSRQNIQSLSGSSSEIAVSLEDDIAVFSYNSFEDCLIRSSPDTQEEEEEVSDWARQNESLSIEEGDCTYESNGYATQLIYICRTCMDPENPFGICEQCAKICHDGHDVRPLGIRHRFRCDCGNGKMGGPCKSMLAPKTSFNPRNTYGHNFSERWCVCDQPDLRSQPMIQCESCSEWYHHECIGMFSERLCPIIDRISELDNFIFVCSKCLDGPCAFINTLETGHISSDTAAYFETAEVNGAIRLAGGTLIAREDLESFAGTEQYEEAFGALDTSAEDAELPRASGQLEYVAQWRDMYNSLFQHVSNQNRSVVQASDVQEVLREHIINNMSRR